MSKSVLIPNIAIIEDNTLETHDVFSLLVKPVQGKEPLGKPGQFYMLSHKHSGEAPISISRIDTKNLEFTVRKVGVVTNLLSALKKGDKIGLRGPFGKSWPLDKINKKHIQLIAGGIGVAPIRGVIEYCLKNIQYSSMDLIYGCRSPKDVVFSDELLAWANQKNVSIKVTVDKPIGLWHGHVGAVTALLDQNIQDPKNTIVLICGPEIMMEFSVLKCLNRGVDPKDIYLTMERRMDCAVGFCGHCLWGKSFVCKDGPIFSYESIGSQLRVKEL